MATRKRKTSNGPTPEAESIKPLKSTDTVVDTNTNTDINTVEKPTEPVKTHKSTSKKAVKYSVGSIVYISKDTEADLNGFKLFPQYKKYTYTVEAYNDITGVYSLRRLNLLLKLKESDIVSPNEKSDSSLIRKQF